MEHCAIIAPQPTNSGAIKDYCATIWSVQAESRHNGIRPPIRHRHPSQPARIESTRRNPSAPVAGFGERCDSSRESLRMPPAAFEGVWFPRSHRNRHTVCHRSHRFFRASCIDIPHPRVRRNRRNTILYYHLFVMYLYRVRHRNLGVRGGETGSGRTRIGRQSSRDGRSIIAAR